MSGIIEMESFVVRIDKWKSANELEEAGKYDYGKNLEWVKLELKPGEIREIVLLRFVQHPILTKTVLFKADEIGLLRPKREDALFFGLQFPEEQRKRPIVFLSDKFIADNNDIFYCTYHFECTCGIENCERDGLDLSKYDPNCGSYVFVLDGSDCQRRLCLRDGYRNWDRREAFAFVKRIS